MRQRLLLGVLLVVLVTTPGCASLVGGDSQPQAVFEKELLDPNTSIEGVGFEVRVTNIGDAAAEGTVYGRAELNNGTALQTVERVELDAGESTVVMLQWESIESLNNASFFFTVERD